MIFYITVITNKQCVQQKEIRATREIKVTKGIKARKGHKEYLVLPEMREHKDLGVPKEHKELLETREP